MQNREESGWRGGKGLVGGCEEFVAAVAGGYSLSVAVDLGHSWRRGLGERCLVSTGLLWRSTENPVHRPFASLGCLCHP